MPRVEIPFPHRRAGHCASGALRDLLEFRGLTLAGEPLSEAMVFGLGAGLGVLLLPEPRPGVPFYLGGRAAGLEESLMARLGGDITRVAESDDDAAWDALRARLDAGEPVALVADCQKLEYLRARTSMPLHVVVATGYDATHVILADNDRDAPQECSHASLRAARAAVGFPLPAMNVRFELRFPARLPDLAACLAPALAEVVQGMRAPSGPAVNLFGADAFGLRALDALEALAAKLPAARGPAARMAILLLWVAIEKGGTGGAFFRGLFRDFLVEARARASTPALELAAAHYADLAAAWAALGARVGGGSLDGVGERLVALVRAERQGVELLARAAAAMEGTIRP